jgi:hypothetical protein
MTSTHDLCCVISLSELNARSGAEMYCFQAHGTVCEMLLHTLYGNYVLQLGILKMWRNVYWRIMKWAGIYKVVFQLPIACELESHWSLGLRICWHQVLEHCCVCSERLWYGWMLNLSVACHCNPLQSFITLHYTNLECSFGPQYRSEKAVPDLKWAWKLHLKNP